MTDFVFVYIPTSNPEEADHIGHALLEKRLTACVNTFPHMHSQYLWKDSIQKENESVLIVKTKRSLLERVKNEVQKIHSYECPCIICIPIENINTAYKDFLEKNLET